MFSIVKITCSHLAGEIIKNKGVIFTWDYLFSIGIFRNPMGYFRFQWENSKSHGKLIFQCEHKKVPWEIVIFPWDFKIFHEKKSQKKFSFPMGILHICY